MTFRYLASLLLGCCLLFNCASDDEASDPNYDFFSDADASVTANQVLGTWAIYRIGFQDQMADVPVPYQDCGRDFMMFSDNEIYSEYLYQDSSCIYELNTLNWTLAKGVITLKNTLQQSELMVVTKVTANELVLKSRYDVDDDGKVEVIFAYLKRYKPLVEKDWVSETFTRNSSDATNHIINYTWQPYQGAAGFKSYEIFRSAGANCSKEEAVLIKTITDSSITEFTDLTPPVEERVCYFLKTTLASGVLGESFLQTLDTYVLGTKPIAMNKPEVLDNSILLTWEESDNPYFSYYEIYYSNYNANTTGYGAQEVSVAKISDRTVTHFTDAHPPFLKDPYYGIRVIDVFGHKTFDNPQGFKTSWQVPFEKEGLVSFIYKLLSYAIDPSEPIVYFYGHEQNASHQLKLYRYNYETNRAEAVSDPTAFLHTELSIEVINSVHGKELILEQGNALHVYDATTMQYKYAIKPQGLFTMHDFLYATAGYWIFTDSKSIFSYTRNGSELTLLDSKPHFSNHQHTYNYTAFEIDNNQLLLGHTGESTSKVYKLNSNGTLAPSKTVAVPIKATGIGHFQYSASGHYVINYDDGQYYSTKNFSKLGALQPSQFGSGISNNGIKIYGSNNNPNWSISLSGEHTKEIFVYDRLNKQLQTVATQGYPQVVFENYRGQVYALSTGLIKRTVHESLNNTLDLFIERINIP